MEQIVEKFRTEEVSGVDFGGFGIDRFIMADGQKRYLWGKTLSQAMILAADKGKGWHLMTNFEWASLAYLWKQAKSLDEMAVNMHSNVWQWVMGLFMQRDGSVDVLASLDVSLAGSPYGRGTISVGGDASVLTVDGQGVNWPKDWPEGAFEGMNVYIAEGSNSGALYPIEKTTPTSLILSGNNAPPVGRATFCIVRHVATDITAGMDSGNRITSLRESDPDLQAFAIPASSNDTGLQELGSDRFWFYKSSIMRAAIRGCNVDDKTYAGVFTLYLNNEPSYSHNGLGFRASKAL